jgi:hypothetical protein
MTLPSGAPLDAAHLYVSTFGVLTDPATGAPRPGGGDQAELLSALLAQAPRLRELLGPAPQEWVRRAAGGSGRAAAVRAAGTRELAASGVRPTPAEAWGAVQASGAGA